MGWTRVKMMRKRTWICSAGIVSQPVAWGDPVADRRALSIRSAVHRCIQNPIRKLAQEVQKSVARRLTSTQTPRSSR